MEKVSIYTIAQRLGVSAATVSRALSGKGRVSPELRQRVAEVARELNYQPNRLARRLSASDISMPWLSLSASARMFAARVDAVSLLRRFE